MFTIHPLQAVFIDRDGTIGHTGVDIQPRNFQPYPYFQPAIAKLKARGLKIFAFTNQPDIASGAFTAAELEQQFAAWGYDQALICPHTDADQCGCRKPAPGMLLEAAQCFGLDLTRCAVIGDSWFDMLAADKVGCIKILVQTGHGREERTQQMLAGITIDYMAEDLWDAARWLIQYIPPNQH